MSANTLYRLADATAVEPLVNRWVAWAHVIPPVAGSLHLLRYQIRLLKSYLDDPAAHARSCMDPKFRSGPFVDIPVERAAEVRELLAHTEQRQRADIRFAESVVEFQNYLAGEAKGQSLEPFYEKLPPPLRGYVELVYDYYNRPIVRFFESLLYESPYYRRDLQSFRVFQEKQDSYRPFIMSTPRLPQPGQLDWDVPFESAEADEFFKLDSVPRPLGYVRELLGLKPEDEPLLRQFLSADAPPPANAWERDEVRVRYLGHACVLIQWKGISVLTDPYVGVMPEGSGVEHLSYAELPAQIDYVLITHNHHDHFCLESLLRLRHRIKCLVVPRSNGIFYGDISLKLLARKIGFRNVVELDALEGIPLEDGEVLAVPFMGEHADLPHGKTAYVVRAAGRQFMLAADSNCLDRRMYEHLRRIIGPIETVFLGMECVGAPLSWSSGPFLPVAPEFSHEQSRRYNGCDSSRALEILEAVGAERIYIYAMGLEPWLEHLLGLAYAEDAEQLRESSRLLRAARQKGFAEARLLYGQSEFLLAPARAAAVSPPAEGRPAPQDAGQPEEQFLFE